MTKRKIAFFTDIHFGKKNNSEQHNKDCLDFIDFFISEVKKDPEIFAIGFLGDLFESRSAINVLTLTYAHEGLKRLDNLGLPIYLCVGNHDLYHRTSRKIHSAEVFQNLTNVILITEPTVVDDKILFVPYMFKHEYAQLQEYRKVKYWAGHFEFRGFVMTGANNKLEHGPDHTQFSGPTYIISGHFHKRQAVDNIVYIGNTFPMDFGDAGDLERGMAILNTEDDDFQFINWENCPSYFKTSLKKVVEGEWIPKANSRIRCLLDIDVTYQEAQVLKEEFVKAYQLREFSIEENVDEKKDILTGDVEDEEDISLGSIDQMVQSLLQKVQGTTTIVPAKLVEIYNTL